MFDVIKFLLFKAKLTEKLSLDSVPLVKISEQLKGKLKILGKKSLAIREIAAGSSNDCEHEIAALENPIYDLNRFGIKTVASPRHADILMVSGPVAPGMKEALIKAYEATPEPRIVIAVGDGAISGRISQSIAGTGLYKVADCVPVDLEIPGNPPSPQDMLLKLLGVLKNV